MRPVRIIEPANIDDVLVLIDEKIDPETSERALAMSENSWLTPSAEDFLGL